jgi:putative transposase
MKEFHAFVHPAARISSPRVNRIPRLYREEGRRAHATPSERGRLVEARPNAPWSVDFVHNQFANGRRFRIPSIVDD